MTDQIVINGQPHKLILLKVEERDAFGRPSKVTCGYDDTVFDLKGGEVFITAYAHADSVVAKTKGNG